MLHQIPESSASGCCVQAQLKTRGILVIDTEPFFRIPGQFAENEFITWFIPQFAEQAIYQKRFLTTLIRMLLYDC